MVGGQLVTPYVCVPTAAGVISLPFQGPVLGGHIFWKPLPTEMLSGSNMQVSASGGGSVQQNTFPVGPTWWKVGV